MGKFAVVYWSGTGNTEAMANVIVEEIKDMLVTLSNHLCLAKEFPHEIGIFLGYPLADVVGFIEHQGHDYVYCGYWKVYGDLRSAVKSFDIYKNCTTYCKDRFEHGDTVLELAVVM